MKLDKKTASYLGIDHLPLEKQFEILKRLEKTINMKVLARLLREMSSSEKEYFLKLITTGSLEEVKDIISQDLPRLSDIVMEEREKIVKEFRDLFLKYKSDLSESGVKKSL
ncbi:MAG: hypothetical protein ACQESA_02685 [Patescibacteria group bacterium]